jgi:hypothetical protein
LFKSLERQLKASSSIAQLRAKRVDAKAKTVSTDFDTVRSDVPTSPPQRARTPGAVSSPPTTAGGVDG